MPGRQRQGKGSQQHNSKTNTHCIPKLEQSSTSVAGVGSLPSGRTAALCKLIPTRLSCRQGTATSAEHTQGKTHSAPLKYLRHFDRRDCEVTAPPPKQHHGRICHFSFSHPALLELLSRGLYAIQRSSPWLFFGRKK